jgi:hypothetical protein
MGIALSAKISTKISKWGLRGKYSSNFENFHELTPAQPLNNNSNFTLYSR